MSPAKLVVLPGHARDDLARLVRGMRAGDVRRAAGWVSMQRTALAHLADVSRGLTEADALRLDRLVRQGRRSTLGALSPDAYAALRRRMGSFLDDALDEMAVRPNMHALVSAA